MTNLRNLKKRDFHTVYLTSSPISDLFAALANSFPLFRRRGMWTDCGRGGNIGPAKVFQLMDLFSTSFPQMTVDDESLCF
jgi:hypothetical protein